MAKPYKEGPSWSFRLRIQGEDIYRPDFASEAAARKALNQLQHTLNGAGKPARQGPWRTTLAQALRDYALERLPALKGAKQDACRINRSLRLAGLATLKLVPAKGAVSDKPEGALLWQIEDVAPRSRQKIPKGLAEHRKGQANRTESSDKQRQKLARMFVADIQAHELQKLADIMVQDGYSAATVGLERAMLSSLFAYAKHSWRWLEPAHNPAQGLKLPKIDNARSRVLSNEEWRAIGTALDSCKNVYLAPALALLLETAMRCSEALVSATWGDFDDERCILRLREAKAGWRDVPLNPGAMDVVRQLQARAQSVGADALLPTAKILPLTYEALKAGWQRACQRAGVQGVNLHDLRHTSATRFALELNGNLPVLKVITGHKTTSQLMRYINIKPDEYRFNLSYPRSRMHHLFFRGLNTIDPLSGMQLFGITWRNAPD
jgi:integrase